MNNTRKVIKTPTGAYINNFDQILDTIALAKFGLEAHAVVQKFI